MDPSAGGGLTVTVETPVVEEASVVAGLTVTEAGQTAADTQPAAVAGTLSPAITELPFTGVNSGMLAILALALALGGTLMLKASSIEVSPNGEVAHRSRHLS